MEKSLTELLSGKDVHLGGAGLQNILLIAGKIREAGKTDLLVISEFDRTLTKFIVDGKVGCCSYGVIDTAALMPEDYRQEVKELKAKYLPLESDLSLSLEKRKDAMHEWYAKAFRSHVKFNLKQQNIPEIISKAKISLREGINDLFDVLEKKEVPLVMFSAGIRDTLMETIRQQSSIRGNMLFVGNRLRFGEDGIASDIPDDIITSYTKGDSEILAPVEEKIKGRGNVIVIGESLGDPDMLDALKTHENAIKIGFLNYNAEELLPAYLSLYDIVLTGDGDMSIITNFLKALLE